MILVGMLVGGWWFGFLQFGFSMILVGMLVGGLWFGFLQFGFSMIYFDEIECDMILVVKATGHSIRVNQMCRANETIADTVGKWYDLGEVTLVENHVG